MIYIYLKDDIHFKDINSSNTFALLSSVNATNDTKENDKKRPLHRLIRYNQFKTFDDEVKLLLNNVNDLHLKYGGMCFLWDDTPSYYDTYKNNINLILKNEYIVDPLNNNQLLERSNTLATIDKLILEKIFLYKDSDLLHYRPTDKFNGMNRNQIKDFFKNLTPKDIKNCKYFTRNF